MTSQTSIFRRIDWLTIALMLILMVFGWLNIYGATYNFKEVSMFDTSNYAGKQLVWMGISFFIGILLFAIDSRYLALLAYVLYAVWLIPLLATRFLAHNINGSYSWITFGPVSLQTAEFAKYFTALALARFMSQYDYKVKKIKDLLIPIALVFIPMVIVIFLQRETGSALVFLSFLFMFYREGMSGYVLLIGFMAALLFILSIRLSILPMPLGTGSVGILVCCLIIQIITICFCLFKRKLRFHSYILTAITVAGYGLSLIANRWITINFTLLSTLITIISAIYIAIVAFLYRHKDLFFLVAFIIGSLLLTYSSNILFQRLQPHQRTRIEVALGIKEDPHGVGYNVRQAQIAIGSGHLTGKGYLKGTQTKLKFVPEQHTDFIFCTIGEEWGFVGCAATLVIFLIFILHIIRIAERQRTHFARIYAYSVASILLFHLTVNIGMVIGLIPVIGIPLPFFSYGGSSLLAFSILIFTLLKLDADSASRENLGYA